MPNGHIPVSIFPVIKQIPGILTLNSVTHDASKQLINIRKTVEELTQTTEADKIKKNRSLPFFLHAQIMEN